jgi:hypothetical protein
VLFLFFWGIGVRAAEPAGKFKEFVIFVDIECQVRGIFIKEDVIYLRGEDFHEQGGVTSIEIFHKFIIGIKDVLIIFKEGKISHTVLG